VQKKSAVVLAVVGVGDGGVATVEGVMRINGTEPEIATKVGVFHQLAANCATIGIAQLDEHEVRTRREGASAGGAPAPGKRPAGRAGAWRHALGEAGQLRVPLDAAE
jgi:hypothetical protein